MCACQIGSHANGILIYFTRRIDRGLKGNKIKRKEQTKEIESVDCGVTATTPGEGQGEREVVLSLYLVGNY